MKKGLLFTLVFMFFGFCSLVAQWEKISPQLTEGELVVTNTVQFENTTACLVKSYEGTYLYYSINQGKNWKKFKSPIPKNSYSGQNIREFELNKDGCFFALYSASSSRLFIHRTKNFGITWQIDTLQGSDLGSSPNFLYIDNDLCVGDENNTFRFKNDNWTPYSRLKVDNIFAYRISSNRYWRYFNSQNDLYLEIFDLNSRKILKSIVTPRAEDTYFNYVQDSIIILSYKDSLFVSRDLGSTWIKNKKTIPNEFFSVQIKGNLIYIHSKTSIYKTVDFGKTWTYLVDTVISGYYSNQVVNNFSEFRVQDSSITVLNGSIFYTRTNNDSTWRFGNTITSNLELIKADSSIILAYDRFATYISKDYGNTWGQALKFNDKYSPYGSSFFIKNVWYISRDSVYKSLDYGKNWIKDVSVPLFNKNIVKGDTIIIKTSNNIQFSTKAPYDKWEILLTGSQYDLMNFNESTVYVKNFSILSQIKLDKSQFRQIPVSRDSTYYGEDYYLYKNKIWLKDNNSCKCLRFTKDLGVNWALYPIPKNLGAYQLFVWGDYLVYYTANTFIKVNGKLNENSGIIYISANDGKSWFKYNEGINLNNVPFNAKFIVSDSFLLLQGINIGLYRTSLSEISLKSISGIIFIDKNKNGIKDTDEKGFPNAKVFLSNAGAFTTADSLGNYAFLADLKATDTLKASIDSKYATYTPQYLLVSQSDTVKNIGVFIPNIQDLVVNGTAITPPRSGFTNSYLLTYKNAGAITKSGKVTFTYNAKQTYVEATQAPTSNVNNTLSWDYANLQPNESRTLKVTFKTAADVPIRTQLTNVATIEPIATDTFKTDNVDSLFQIVVGSYDPNDKQVSFLNTRQAPSVIDPNTEMTYTIRFQNTGNYQADFVRVTDTLSDKLDLTTLRVLATSHNYTLSVKNKNVLQFEFNPIYLPDSMTSEANSHGFIKFAIKPKKTLTKDEVIKNTAYIFFDYNPAIITNTVETANQKVNGLFTPSVLESLSVFPNPTNGEISFSLDKYQGKALSINVYSIDGKLMINKHTVGEAVNRINGEGLRNGLYVLQVRVGDDIVFGKFMVQK
jgi:uncharacterized repeat protein (TIGR01451 family)